jgi:hypothetical protein
MFKRSNLVSKVIRSLLLSNLKRDPGGEIRPGGSLSVAPAGGEPSRAQERRPSDDGPRRADRRLIQPKLFAES